MSPLHLQTLRGKLGLTKAQLAFELGVTVDTVRDWNAACIASPGTGSTGLMLWWLTYALEGEGLT